MGDAQYHRLDDETKTSQSHGDRYGQREASMRLDKTPLSVGRWSKNKIIFAVCLLLLVGGLIGSYKSPEIGRGSNTYRIAKVSMVYGKKNEMYERALQSHILHGERWGYPTWILRRDDYCGYWNKPTFIISKLAQELAKSEGERMEWLMWVDADSIVINPSIPAHIFLPPRQHSQIHFVGTKDIQGLNTGVFFLRVHPWSITMLTDSMAFPLCHADIDLGNDADQASMAHTLMKTQGGLDNNGFKNNVVYVPKRFFNSYELPGYERGPERTDLLRNFPGFNQSHGFEGEKGEFIVHFPGLHGDRAPFMNDWLNMVENNQSAWEVPLEETTYASGTTEFWEMYSTAVSTVEEAEMKNPTNGSALFAATQQLKVALSEEADDVSSILEYTNELNSNLEELKQEQS